MIRLRSAWILMALVLPVSAQNQSGGVQGSSGLNGGGLHDSRSGRLQSSGGLRSGGGLSNGRQGLQTSPLDSSRLDSTKKQASTKLDSVRSEADRARLNPATLKKTAGELTRGGLSTAKIESAATTIPKSQVGALLYDVALELEAIEDQDMMDVAVGYYMAALADPEGERHQDAKKRLFEIFLDPKLEHEDAVHLYDQGKTTLDELSDSTIGLTPNGKKSGLLELRELRAAYHARREREKAVEEVTAPEAAPDESEEADDPPAEGE